MSIRCTSLHYSLSSPTIPTVGIVVLKSDEVIEDELRHWLTPNTRLLHTRIPSGDSVTKESLSAMESALPNALSLLPTDAPISVIAYGCTSGTTVIGEEKVAQLVHDVFPKAEVTNPLTAVKAKLHDLSAKKVALLTPYEPTVSQALHDHLTQHGIDIVSFGSFNEPLESNVSRIDQESLMTAIKTLHDQAHCDAIFASCTNLRTANWLDHFSAVLSTPVLSSNSALSWHINQLTSNAQRSTVVFSA